VAGKKHQLALAAARQAHQRTRHRLLVELFELLAPAGAFQHHRAIGADAEFLDARRRLVGIDVADREFGRRRGVALQEIVDVAAKLRVRAHERRHGHRLRQFGQHLTARVRQRVAPAGGPVEAAVVALREVAQQSDDSDEQRDCDHALQAQSEATCGLIRHAFSRPGARRPAGGC
jgi:hypothetical protein